MLTSQLLLIVYMLGFSITINAGQEASAIKSMLLMKSVPKTRAKGNVLHTTTLEQLRMLLHL